MVCDLAGGVGGVTAKHAEMLASAGRHPRDWPGVPVALSCPDSEVHAAAPVAAESTPNPHLFRMPACSLSTVSPAHHGRAAPRAASRRAQRGARAFVARTCLDWQLRRRKSHLIAPELVAHAITEQPTQSACPSPGSAASAPRGQHRVATGTDRARTPRAFNADQTGEPAASAKTHGSGFLCLLAVHQRSWAKLPPAG